MNIVITRGMLSDLPFIFINFFSFSFLSFTFLCYIRYQDEEWNEHDGTLDPPPNCSLNDPVITHLLSSWTNDSKKLKLLSNWLKHVLSNKKIKSTKSFRPGNMFFSCISI
jgi:hypothetical protein